MHDHNCQIVASLKLPARLKGGVLCGRMEPLILEGAEMRRPVFAAYAKGGRRLAVGLQEMGESRYIADKSPRTQEQGQQ